ncbi:MAG: T9SS type A sorting domain-containing protein [Bacteroidales bacterium]|nr:T9SS type A sorting domain-containing protein [Bacteroidales bacterium]
MKGKWKIKTISKFARTIMMMLLQPIFIIGLTYNAIAQELYPGVISTGGETYIASGYSLDFVIGEIVTESYTEQGFMLTQGFLQGNEEELAINEHTVHVDDIDVFPNPISDMVYIMCKVKQKPVRIEIEDLQGCMVYSLQFKNNPMEANLKQLNPGLYVLTLIFPDHNFVSKKIIKK